MHSTIYPVKLMLLKIVDCNNNNELCFFFHVVDSLISISFYTHYCGLESDTTGQSDCRYN